MNNIGYVFHNTEHIKLIKYVRVRERESEREGKRERDLYKLQTYICVCVCYIHYVLKGESVRTYACFYTHVHAFAYVCYWYSISRSSIERPRRRSLLQQIMRVIKVFSSMTYDLFWHVLRARASARFSSHTCCFKTALISRQLNTLIPATLWSDALTSVRVHACVCVF